MVRKIYRKQLENNVPEAGNERKSSCQSSSESSLMASVALLFPNSFLALATVSSTTKSANSSCLDVCCRLAMVHQQKREVAVNKNNNKMTVV